MVQKQLLICSILILILAALALNNLSWSSKLNKSKIIQIEKKNFGIRPINNSDSSLLTQSNRLLITKEVDTGCEIGMGYTVMFGCKYHSPFQQYPTKATILSTKTTKYTANVVSQKTQKSIQLNQMAKGQAGWGQGMSGSAQFQIEQTQNELVNSYEATYMSHTVILSHNLNLDFRNLKLLPEAKSLLEKSPRLFFQTYGEYLVSEQTFGSELVLSQHFQSDNQSAMNEMKNTMGASANFELLGYSAEVQRNLQEKMKALATQVKVTYKERSVGSDANLTYNSLGDIEKNAKYWNERLKPESLTFGLVKWSESFEIQQIIQNSNGNIQNEFYLDEISQTALNQLTNNYLTIENIENQLHSIPTIAKTLLDYRLKAGYSSTEITRLKTAMQDQKQLIENVGSLKLRSLSKQFDSAYSIQKISDDYEKLMEDLQESYNFIKEDLCKLMNSGVVSCYSSDAANAKYFEAAISKKYPKLKVQIHEYRSQTKCVGRKIEKYCYGYCVFSDIKLLVCIDEN